MALEKATGIEDRDQGRRYMQWVWGSRDGPEPAGAKAANRMMLEELLKISASSEGAP